MSAIGVVIISRNSNKIIPVADTARLDGRFLFVEVYGSCNVNLDLTTYDQGVNFLYNIPVDVIDVMIDLSQIINEGYDDTIFTESGLRKLRRVRDNSNIDSLFDILGVQDLNVEFIVDNAINNSRYSGLTFDLTDDCYLRNFVTRVSTGGIVNIAFRFDVPMYADTVDFIKRYLRDENVVFGAHTEDGTVDVSDDYAAMVSLVDEEVLNRLRNGESIEDIWIDDYYVEKAYYMLDESGETEEDWQRSTIEYYVDEDDILSRFEEESLDYDIDDRDEW